MTQKQILKDINKFCRQCWDFKREGACEGKVFNMDNELIDCPLHNINPKESKRKLLKKVRTHCFKLCCNGYSAVVENCQEEGNESECCLYEYRLQAVAKISLESENKNTAAM